MIPAAVLALIPKKLKDNFIMILVVIGLVVGYSFAVYHWGKANASNECTSDTLETITDDGKAHAEIKVKNKRLPTPDLDKRLDRWVRPD